MRSARSKFWFSVAIASVGLSLAAPSLAVSEQVFGTREIVACPLRNIPKTGAPSVQLATRYFVCDTERIGDSGENIYLVSSVHLQVAPRGRAFNPASDTFAGVDRNQAVYDLHGDFRIYQCGMKGGVAWQTNPGHACRYQEFFDQTGLCWKNSDNEWHCAMNGTFDVRKSVHDVAPPEDDPTEVPTTHR